MNWISLFGRIGSFHLGELSFSIWEELISLFGKIRSSHLVELNFSIRETFILISCREAQRLVSLGRQPSKGDLRPKSVTDDSDRDVPSYMRRYCSVHCTHHIQCTVYSAVFVCTVRTVHLIKDIIHFCSLFCGAATFSCKQWFFGKILLE